ncbi:Fungalysin metallopeptidase-domain-containing protein [Mycena sp. CBHHK59/15]|nr:Fungalysin metallopeptidase-domain-containing protein [Mycena sp. CBHHK59/15]
MDTFHPSTHREITIRPRVTFVVSHPPATYETYGDGLPSGADLLPSSEISPDSDIIYTSGYRKGMMTYAYVQQAYAADQDEQLEVKAVIPLAQQELDGTHNGHPAKLEYLMKPDGHLVLAHVIQIQNEDTGTWYEVFMDAHSGQLLSLNDFNLTTEQYTVLPIPGEAVPPDGFKMLTDPAHTVASPSIIADPGWYSVSTSSTTTTAGNNVIAYKGDQNSTTDQSSATLNFNYSFDASKDPTDANNLNAAHVNAFYIANTFHDFTKRYGFTEDAFNFQEYNFNEKVTEF